MPFSFLDILIYASRLLTFLGLCLSIPASSCLQIFSAVFHSSQILLDNDLTQNLCHCLNSVLLSGRSDSLS